MRRPIVFLTLLALLPGCRYTFSPNLPPGIESVAVPTAANVTFEYGIEQELTADGRMIGIARYGRSFDGSAFYEHQASLNFLLYDPPPLDRIRNDVVGVAFNWVKPNVDGARSEYDFELFYRFPLFPLVDVTLSYQAIFNPALDLGKDYASVFGLRLRTTF